MGQKVTDESYALVDGPVARLEAGYKSTPGCNACDEERSAMKRRDRPFNHTSECHEKQADFRARLRKMEMLPIMSVIAVSFFPWSGSSRGAMGISFVSRWCGRYGSL